MPTIDRMCAKNIYFLKYSKVVFTDKICILYIEDRDLLNMLRLQRTHPNVRCAKFSSF